MTGRQADSFLERADHFPPRHHQTGKAKGMTPVEVMPQREGFSRPAVRLFCPHQGISTAKKVPVL